MLARGHRVCDITGLIRAGAPRRLRLFCSLGCFGRAIQLFSAGDPPWRGGDSPCWRIALSSPSFCAGPCFEGSDDRPSGAIEGLWCVSETHLKLASAGIGDL